ncbi:hypothetical protein LR010_01115 [Candidatus Gracilibacteria bacterium]|nr:hypothetical protein [Candidatus Gracilibacteria bacterium]
METKSNILYNWNYEDNKSRSPLWYIIALSIAIGLIIWGFLTRQYGMSIVVMLVVGFFYFLENNSEDRVAVEVTDLGIKVQGNFYDYSRIGGYSIVYSGENALHLRLLMKKRGISVLNLNVNNVIASDLRSILPNYIEENEKQEITLGERIIHLLKL